jgi:ribosomal protein L37E
MRTLLVCIAIMIAGATAVRAQTWDTVIFGLPLYNRDEAVKKQCEETAQPAVSKSACMAAAAKKEKDGRDDLTKIWNSLDSSIRLQCITNLSVDSYTGLKLAPCIAIRQTEPRPIGALCPKCGRASKRYEVFRCLACGFVFSSKVKGATFASELRDRDDTDEACPEGGGPYGP